MQRREDRGRATELLLRLIGFPPRVGALAAHHALYTGGAPASPPPRCPSLPGRHALQPPAPTRRGAAARATKRRQGLQRTCSHRANSHAVGERLGDACVACSPVQCVGQVLVKVAGSGLARARAGHDLTSEEGAKCDTQRNLLQRILLIVPRRGHTRFKQSEPIKRPPPPPTRPSAAQTHQHRGRHAG